jgi:hypothetical protein
MLLYVFNPILLVSSSFAANFRLFMGFSHLPQKKSTAALQFQTI